MSKKMLHISPDMVMPLSTVTATTVVYGGKGMGKTNFGAVLVEELARAGLRWSVLDPMGVWWGMRHSADGKGAGVECLILGGAHGDIPIEPTGGAVVADLVADHSVSVIIDISRRANGEMWSIGERIRFVTDYGKQLFRRQGALIEGRRREPICQVIDEAARFLPQSPRAGDIDAAKCEGVWSAIVEEGRNIGIGVVLLTQRSARLNKNVAELADLMLAFRTVGPNSIRAVVDWLGEHIPKDEVRSVIEQLRSLPRGSALAVSPGWLQVQKVVPVRMRTTFDSSATPKPGEQAPRVRGEGAKPDLAIYAARMRETIERAAADDPKALRKRIAELEAAAKKPPAGASGTKTLVVDTKAAVAETRTRDRERIAMLTAQVQKLQKTAGAYEKQMTTVLRLAASLTQTADQIRAAVEAAQGAAAEIGAEPLALPVDLPAAAPSASSTQERIRVATRPLPIAAAATQADSEAVAGLGGPAKKILAALARFSEIGVDAPPRMQICLWSDYHHLNSSGFVKALGSLSSAGLIRYPGDGKVALTAEGAAAAPAGEPIGSDEDLQAKIFETIGGPGRKILTQLIAAYPNTVSRDELLTGAGYNHPNSSGFVKAIGQLKTLGYIDYPTTGVAIATEQCFLPR